LPISAAGISLPLKWNEDVRAVTRSPLILESTLSSSSASPSEKYSSTELALRFANGSTAIEAVSVAPAANARKRVVSSAAL